MAKSSNGVVTEFDYGELKSIPDIKNLNIRFEDIAEIYQNNHPKSNLDLLSKAYVFSAKEHMGQVRRSGDPYLVHPMNVAKMLAEMNLDDTTIAVGFLHDVVEDTDVTIDKIKEHFGEDIARLVDGVTKVSQIEFHSIEHKQAENFRKLWLATARDVRVIIVKIADRFHNMLTLDAMPAYKQKRIARETLDIYVPIANRLGMGNIQRDMQELAFKYLYPRQYKVLTEKIEREKKVSILTIQRIEKILKKEFEKLKIEALIRGRIKSNFSIFTKMKKQDISLDEIYDYLAFRVITKSVSDCYTVLGIVHSIWKPIPGRFKDYIAMPKPNNYRSLHTSVLDLTGHVFEVQIRTEWMDIIAQEGVPAHWRYKEDGGKITDEQELQYVNWLRDLVQRQQEWQHPDEFINALKIDLYPDTVYCFTPKGEVKSFPSNATTLDFAYSIHTEIGNTTIGAKVNGKIVPLKTRLRNGDVVEIITRKDSTPKRDWLHFVKTPRALAKIRQHLNKEEKERSQEIGEKMLRKEFAKHSIQINKTAIRKELLELASGWGLNSLEDIYAAVGYGKISLKQILSKFVPEDEEEQKPALVGKIMDKVTGRSGSTVISVRGHNDIMVNLAKCCSPLPGEPIIGFITRGRGISIHSKACPNVSTLSFNPDRIIDAKWEAAKGEIFHARLKVKVDDSSGMLAKITQELASLEVNIKHLEARSTDDNRALVDILAEIRDLKHLSRIMTGIQELPGVISVQRVFKEYKESRL
ncbi:MAG: bifunctional (p)ppGpp synthetase/guanosine-3',5'-bis(diphosphate) 3'-pyrophosphohydrolase [Acidobacteria bacterium]|nr:bifunctional (p)ppGpp synthetase/guanosine-3',5'-bis(diphosphate) 3'-pyrophosphohydrolase [Acidobacteriota bacterium]